MLSRISGFVKVAAIAAFYGRSVEADMLIAVMVLPDLVYKFLSEGLVSGAAVPVFVNCRESRTETHKAFWSIFWITTIICSIVSIILILGKKEFCCLLMPELGVTNEAVIHFMWLMLVPYLSLGFMGGVLTSLLNARQSFGMPAVGPLIVNIAIIIGTFIAAGNDVRIIAVANTVGALLQLIWLLWLAYRDEFLEKGFRKCWILDKALAGDFIKASAPIMAWISILPFIPVYERRLLSPYPGAIATFNYTEKLFNLPLGVVSISLAHVVLPNLSLLEGKERHSFLNKSLGMATLVILPIILVIWSGAGYIVEIVFKRGKFTMDDVSVAASLFRVYILALLPVSLNMVLNRGFFAAGNYRIPFVAGLVSALVQFYICFKAVPAYGMQGVAYAAITAATLQLIILFAKSK